MSSAKRLPRKRRPILSHPATLPRAWPAVCNTSFSAVTANLRLRNVEVPTSEPGSSVAPRRYPAFAALPPRRVGQPNPDCPAVRQFGLKSLAYLLRTGRAPTLPSPHSGRSSAHSAAPIVAQNRTSAATPASKAADQESNLPPPGSFPATIQYAPTEDPSSVVFEFDVEWKPGAVYPYGIGPDPRSDNATKVLGILRRRVGLPDTADGKVQGRRL